MSNLSLHELLKKNGDNNPISQHNSLFTIKRNLSKEIDALNNQIQAMDKDMDELKASNNELVEKVKLLLNSKSNSTQSVSKSKTKPITETKSTSDQKVQDDKKEIEEDSEKIKKE